MTLSLAFQTYGSMADFSLMDSRMFYMLAFLMFAFGGIELIGMTAAEAENPEKVFHKPLTKLFSEFWFLRGFAGNYYVAYSMESTGPRRFR